MSVTSTDPIADMLTRIRNAINVRKNEVSLPHSKAKEAVANILKQSGFVAGVRVSDLAQQLLERQRISTESRSRQNQLVVVS